MVAANHPTNQALWKQKAAAFVTRSHHHLWGKNNEDPLIFLFHQDLTNQFIKDIHLGWNKHSQKRTMGKWGLGVNNTATQNNEQPTSSFILPPGIVFPYIVKKELLSVWIQPMDPASPPFLVPGSTKRLIRLGNGNNPIKKINGLLNGLCLFQKNQGTLCVEIQT
ncbi:MAG: hypothetical protein GY710_16065 [Desulfobacteraceae bacterium]|nr:hypothetical protein [Desulfobacteraceae bacterium]